MMQICVIIFRKWYYLPFQDILSIEMIAFKYSTVTHKKWKKLRTEKYYSFKWSDCLHDPFADKYHYLLSRAIEVFVKILQPDPYRPHKVAQAEPLNLRALQRFNGLAKRFSCNFGAYINGKIHFLAHGTTAPSPLDTLTGQEEGGDLLVKALYHTRLHTRGCNHEVNRFIRKCSQEAVKKKALYTPYLLYHVIPLNHHGDLVYQIAPILQMLAMQAAAVKDYRPYDFYFIRDECHLARIMYEAGIDDNPSVLAHYKMDDSPTLQKELFDCAIERYEEDEVPYYIWTYAAFCYEGLEGSCPDFIKKTNWLFQKAIETSKSQMIPELLERAMKRNQLNLTQVKLDDCGTLYHFLKIIA